MAEVWDDISEGDAWWQWLKANTKDRVWGAEANTWKELLAHYLGLQLSGNQLRILWDTARYTPWQLSPFICYTNSSRLYSTLKENSFLFSSERTVVFSLWYAQAWYLIGYLRNSFAEWSSNVYLWWCLWEWHKLEWFHSFLCSFMHSLVPFWK